MEVNDQTAAAISNKSNATTTSDNLNGTEEPPSGETRRALSQRLRQLEENFASSPRKSRSKNSTPSLSPGGVGVVKKAVQRREQHLTDDDDDDDDDNAKLRRTGPRVTTIPEGSQSVDDGGTGTERTSSNIAADDRRLMESPTMSRSTTTRRGGSNSRSIGRVDARDSIIEAMHKSEPNFGLIDEVAEEPSPLMKVRKNKVVSLPIASPTFSSPSKPTTTRSVGRVDARESILEAMHKSDQHFGLFDDIAEEPSPLNQFRKGVGSTMSPIDRQNIRSISDGGILEGMQHRSEHTPRATTRATQPIEGPRRALSTMRGMDSRALEAMHRSEGSFGGLNDEVAEEPSPLMNFRKNTFSSPSKTTKRSLGRVDARESILEAMQESDKSFGAEEPSPLNQFRKSFGSTMSPIDRQNIRSISDGGMLEGMQHQSEHTPRATTRGTQRIEGPRRALSTMRGMDGRILEAMHRSEGSFGGLNDDIAEEPSPLIKLRKGVTSTSSNGNDSFRRGGSSRPVGRVDARESVIEAMQESDKNFGLNDEVAEEPSPLIKFRKGVGSTMSSFDRKNIRSIGEDSTIEGLHRSEHTPRATIPGVQAIEAPRRALSTMRGMGDKVETKVRFENLRAIPGGQSIAPISPESRRTPSTLATMEGDVVTKIRHGPPSSTPGAQFVEGGSGSNVNPLSAREQDLAAKTRVRPRSRTPGAMPVEGSSSAEPPRRTPATLTTLQEDVTAKSRPGPPSTLPGVQSVEGSQSNSNPLSSTERDLAAKTRLRPRSRTQGAIPGAQSVEGASLERKLSTGMLKGTPATSRAMRGGVDGKRKASYPSNTPGAEAMNVSGHGVARRERQMKLKANPGRINAGTDLGDAQNGVPDGDEDFLIHDDLVVGVVDVVEAEGMGVGPGSTTNSDLVHQTTDEGVENPELDVPLGAHGVAVNGMITSREPGMTTGETPLGISSHEQHPAGLEDIFPEQAQQLRRRKNSSNSCLLCCAFLGVLALVATGVYFLTKNDEEDPIIISPTDDVGTDPPISSPVDSAYLERLSAVQNLIVNSVTFQNILNDETSPQYSALMWTVDEDLSPISNESPPEEREALVQRYVLAVFYYALNGDAWLSSDGWLEVDTPVCTWEFVFCTEEGMVSSINTGGDPRNMRGPLPFELQYLPHLSWLILPSNGITEFRGTLENLVLLDLAGNRMGGEIPTSIYKMTNLETLSLGSNELAGKIDPSIGDLSNLRVLSLTDNLLSGQLSSHFLTLKNVTSIDLAANSLEGNIHEVFVGMSNLEFLNIMQNSFAGSIGSELASLESLESFFALRNFLSGTIPSEISNFTRLSNLELAENYLSGSLPTELGSLSNTLGFLSLRKNQFSGRLPSELGLLTQLREFQGATNNFSGQLPSELGQLGLLGQLSVSANSLSGSIPTNFGNLSNLEVMQLSRNFFTGPIPITFGGLQKLETLELDRNVDLTGIVPLLICTLPLMQELVVPCKIPCSCSFCNCI